jgi:hypothetical protein
MGLCSLACIFGGSLVGMAIRQRLPGHHLKEESKDTIKLGAGMIATLGALVLGLLVGSAKSAFDSTNAGITQIATRVVLLDRLLAQCGPDAAPIRLELRTSVAHVVDRVWGEHPHVLAAGDPHAWPRAVESMEAQIARLATTEPVPQHARQQALQVCAELKTSGWMLVNSDHTDLPLPLLVALVLWLSMLFASFGLFAPRNTTVVVVLFTCSVSVATAIFLISEMNRPLHGFVQVGPGAMTSALENLGK